jgi:hypothetical protein
LDGGFESLAILINSNPSISTQYTRSHSGTSSRKMKIYRELRVSESRGRRAFPGPGKSAFRASRRRAIPPREAGSREAGGGLLSLPWGSSAPDVERSVGVTACGGAIPGSAAHPGKLWVSAILNAARGLPGQGGPDSDPRRRRRHESTQALSRHRGGNPGGPAGASRAGGGPIHPPPGIRVRRFLELACGLLELGRERRGGFNRVSAEGGSRD